jgi:ring-1,2-phenylacetyl-CoA epoxidase subunit PaaC
MTKQEALYKYTLRLGDNALILSQRLSEWCSNGPFLEEDLALTNFALDLIGRAQVLLKYAAELEGKGKTEDMLAFRRSERQYYNHQLAELPNGDFAFTMVRQFFISAYEVQLFSKLRNGNDDTLAAIAAKTLKEVKYHLAHAEDWIVRLGNGTDESHKRTQAAVNALWMYTGELFETDEVEQLMVSEGIGMDATGLATDWKQHVKNTLDAANIAIPETKYMQTGGKRGIHTEHLGHLLAEMQYLQRAYPDATW